MSIPSKAPMSTKTTKTTKSTMSVASMVSNCHLPAMLPWHLS